MQSVDLRRRVQIGLNKGEAKNSFSRAVFFNRLGEIRDQSYESQRYRASALNLVVAAIILWNTVYLQKAIDKLKETEDLDESLFPHVSPLGWGHINLNGDYIWSAPNGATLPLRVASLPLPYIFDEYLGSFPLNVP